MKNLIIFGSAEIAELAHYYFDNDSGYNVLGFTVDDEYLSEDTLQRLPVIPWSEVVDKFKPSDTSMHVALSYKHLNRLREEKYLQAKGAGYKLANYVSSKSATWPDLTTGDNCFILENQTVQPTVKIGSNVMLWSGNHIGHGTVIKDHVYVASQVVISGHCDIGERSFLGVNATIKDFTHIGADCFIAMDACVTRDLEDGSVVLSAPSEIYPVEDRRAKVIKKKYFG